jgi:DHA2 family multidrug resistance protein
MASVAAPARSAPAPQPGASAANPPYGRTAMIVAGMTLALANFVVVLDLTIANVSIPHIAGALAVTPQDGTYVVTSYSVAEAICVPLTGWLVARFGAVRSFIFALAGFGLFSMLCGLSQSIGMLVFCRLGQGFAGGPLMPLTQTLLLRVFPENRRPQATAMWAMTTVTAPIAGPILGGWISDGWSWQWIFFINVPVVAACLTSAIVLLRRVETPTRKDPIDLVGLALLVVWVGALQLMLDLGREKDWFASSFIWTCAITSAIGFGAFLIWELTEKHPIVDLKIFRHRGFVAAMIAMSVSYGAFFASIVVIPQWLQSSMGYTATYAGYAMAFQGIFAVMMAPFVPQLMKRIDARVLVSFGVAWMGMTCLLRTQWNTDMGFWSIAIPQLIQGFGMPMFFIPITVISLSAVLQSETASASGLMNFARTLSGAFMAAISGTAFSNLIVTNHVRLSDTLNAPDSVLAGIRARGFDPLGASSMLEGMVTQQATALAITQIFGLAALMFFVASATVWLSPRPKAMPQQIPSGH